MREWGNRIDLRIENLLFFDSCVVFYYKQKQPPDIHAKEKKLLFYLYNSININNTHTIVIDPKCNEILPFDWFPHSTYAMPPYHKRP